MSAPRETTRHNYYLINKPKGVICTNDRREARKRAIDLITDPDAGRIGPKGPGRGLIVPITGLHLARSIASKLERRFHRPARIRYPEESHLMYVDWEG